jgi:selenocysteine lyase/cysteine desulfurase
MAHISSQRHLFEIPEDIAYFNCSYNSPLLNSSRDALVAGAQSKSHPWQRLPRDFFDDAETVRVLASQLFGCDADGYAIIPAASYGLSTAARALESQLQPGDHIVLMAEEFPSNVLPWQRSAEATGATIVTVPKPEGRTWTEALLERLDSTVKIAALSPCHWTDGALVDLEAISRACRSLGIILVIDATQTLGAMPFNLAEIQPDFLIAAGYKWLLCPYGFSLLYVAPRWRDARPLEESWLARSNAENFAGLVHYSPTYQLGARRFDVGEKCMPTLLPGAIAALSQLNAWGTAAIAASLEMINQKIAEKLTSLGFRLPPAAERCPHILGARLPVGLSLPLVEALKAENIFISQRGDALRFAPHLHIEENDLARLFAVLERLIGR